MQIGNLADYHEKIEQVGWQGNQTARLALAKMYDRGLGVENNQACALAWLRRGRKKANRQPGCDEELGDFLAFMELAARVDKAIGAEAKRAYDDWIKRYRSRPVRKPKTKG